MNNKQLARLRHCCKGRSARQRIILFLIAEGRSVPYLVYMTGKELSTYDIPSEYQDYQDEVLSKLPDVLGAAFVFKGGKSFKHTDIYRVIRQSTLRNIGKVLNSREFIDYIKKDTLP